MNPKKPIPAAADLTAGQVRMQVEAHHAHPTNPTFHVHTEHNENGRIVEASFYVPAVFMPALIGAVVEPEAIVGQTFLVGPQPAPQADSKPASVMEAAENGAPYLTGHWSHIFADSASERTVRLVIDRSAEKIVAMDIMTGRGYVPATAAAIADVQDSLQSANAEAFTNPGEYDLEEVSQMPEWALAADDEPDEDDEQSDAPRG